MSNAIGAARVNRVLGFVLVAAGLLGLPRPAEAAAGEHTASATSEGGAGQFVDHRVSYRIQDDNNPNLWHGVAGKVNLPLPYDHSTLLAPGYYRHWYIRVTGGLTSGKKHQA
jgi:hypothetical protein